MMFIWYVCYWLTWAPRRWLRRSAGVLIRWRRGQVKQDQDPNTGMDLATATVTAMDNWDLQLSPWCQGGTFAEASSSVKTASDWNRWKKLEEDGRRRRNPQDLKDCSAMLSHAQPCSAMLSLSFIFIFWFILAVWCCGGRSQVAAHHGSSTGPWATHFLSARIETDGSDGADGQSWPRDAPSVDRHSARHMASQHGYTMVSYT